MINYEKRSLEYNFSLTFNGQKKLTKLWSFSHQKSENYNNGGMVRESLSLDFRIILNAKYFFWQSKVNRKLYSIWIVFHNLPSKKIQKS